MSLRTVAGVILSIAFAAAARADTIETFSVSGTGTVTGAAYYGQSPTLLPDGIATGSLTIDTTTGTILAFSVIGTDGDFGTSASLDQVIPSSSVYADISSEYYSLWIDDSDPAANDFVNFSSGSFVLQDEGQHGGDPYGRIFQSYAGTISAEDTVTPEPSSFILLGTGLLGLGCVFSKRLKGTVFPSNCQSPSWR